MRKMFATIVLSIASFSAQAEWSSMLADCVSVDEAAGIINRAGEEIIARVPAVIMDSSKTPVTGFMIVTASPTTGSYTVMVESISGKVVCFMIAGVDKSSKEKPAKHPLAEF